MDTDKEVGIIEDNGGPGGDPTPTKGRKRRISDKKATYTWTRKRSKVSF